MPSGSPTLSVVVVTHDSRPAIAASLPAVVAQLRDGDELIVVDNDSRDGSAKAARELAPAAIVIETGANAGFAAGCNRGAAAASGELLCFLNPDARPAPGWREALERPLVEGRGWAAWQGLVTAERGRVVNTRGGVLHFTGIAWAGGAGEPLDLPAAGERGGEPPPEGRSPHRPPPAGAPLDRAGASEPGFVSGACLVIPRETYRALGGMPEPYFLYHEDVDLSLRVRLAGGPLGVVPEARVDHEYEFAKGAAKWRYLERNRWATIIRTYPAALLAVAAPALLATELALLVVAARGGWLGAKLAAYADLARALPRLLAERRAIQADRRVGAGELARALSAELDSPYLGRAGRSRALNTCLRAYWAAARALLGAR